MTQRSVFVSSALPGMQAVAQLVAPSPTPTPLPPTRNGHHPIGVELDASSYDAVFADGAKLLDLGFSKDK